MTHDDIKYEINRVHRRILFHCFLYYALDETLISDSEFDELRQTLVNLHRKYPHVVTSCVYYKICKEFVTSPSGYFIKEYPQEIISVALRVLYNVRRPNESFVDWIARKGFKLEKGI